MKLAVEDLRLSFHKDRRSDFMFMAKSRQYPKVNLCILGGYAAFSKFVLFATHCTVKFLR